MYELSLATIAVNAGVTSILSGNITDTRSDGSVCGFVSSTITNLPYLTPNRVLTSNADGELEVSNVSSTELGFLGGVTSALQTQLNGKQATINGGASSIVSNNLGASKALVSDGKWQGSGKQCQCRRISVYRRSNLGDSKRNSTANSPIITGAISPVVSSNLPANKVAISDEFGKTWYQWRIIDRTQFVVRCDFRHSSAVQWEIRRI